VQRCHSNTKTDCEEKRDPDERHCPKRNKEKELDLNTQLEKPTLVAVRIANVVTTLADIR